MSLSEPKRSDIPCAIPAADLRWKEDNILRQHQDGNPLHTVGADLSLIHI